MRLFTAALLLFATSLATAQSTADALRTRLLHAPLYLRCLCAQDALQFDGSGKLQSATAPISFTLSGVEITALDLGRNSLALKGHRVGLTFDLNGVARREVLKVRTSAFRTHDEEIRIDIAAPPGTDYGPALDAIFAEKTDDLAASLPPEWQPFAARHLHSPALPLSEGSEPNRENPEQPPRLPGVRKVGGAVSPPVVNYQPEPTFSEQARANRVSGKVLVYLILERDGIPSHVSIVRPCGMGLDEKAAAAVASYRFIPAMQDGKPVRVEMNVEVNFQIY